MEADTSVLALPNSIWAHKFGLKRLAWVKFGRHNDVNAWAQKLPKVLRHLQRVHAMKNFVSHLSSSITSFSEWPTDNFLGDKCLKQTLFELNYDFEVVAPIFAVPTVQYILLGQKTFFWASSRLKVWFQDWRCKLIGNTSAKTMDHFSRRICPLSQRHSPWR